MEYRKEINGLRAIAVLSIIFFHAGFNVFTGGFVGVDIFFIISGYLITSVIFNQLQEDRFSLLSFYERRVRRIFPALFLIIFLCVPAGWLILSPDQYRDFFQTLLPIGFFAQNFYFWKTRDYFSPAAEESPLLHTWSIAVEEQFYLIFPLLLVLIYINRRHHISLALIILATASFILCEWVSHVQDSAAFYLLPTRAWQLLVGALCATLRIRRWENNFKIQNILAFLGLVLVAFSILFLDKNTRYPSLYAIPVTLGTGLIIRYAQSGTYAARILSIKPLFFIGLISYSLYLWHQPLFAFAQIYNVKALANWLIFLFIAATFLLASLTWKFVEQPFRNNTRVTRRRSFFIFSGALIVALSLISYIGYKAEGYPSRIASDTRELIETQTQKNPFRYSCHYSGINSLKDLPGENCVFGPNPNNIDIAIIGDSHADTLAGSLMQAALDQGKTITQITFFSGCSTFKHYTRGRKHCDKINERVFDYIENSNIEKIVISSRYTNLYWNKKFNNHEGGEEHGRFDPIRLTGPLVKYQDVPPMKKAEIVIQRTINDLLKAGKKVILVYPIPEAGWNVKNYAYKQALTRGKNFNISTQYSIFKDRVKPIYETLDGLSHPNLYKVFPEKRLCNSFTKGRCVNAFGKQIFYYDNNHLSLTGADLVAQDIEPLL